MKETTKLNVDEMVLCDRLRKMKFSAMAKKLEEIFSDPLSPNRTFLECATDLVNSEWDQRAEKKYRRLLSKANLKFPDAAFDEKIYKPERKIDIALVERLSSCEWIREGKVLLITGLTGTGKSHLACAFANAASRKNLTVYFCAAEIFLAKAELAEREKRQLEFIDEMASYDLLIIDDFGLMNLDVEKCTRLFTVLNVREKKKATIVTSQCPVSGWYQMFSERTHADACLDRLSKGSFRIPLEGPSLREAD